MGQAITYAYTLWPRMRNYLKNGRLKIDNNLAYPKVLIIWWKMPSDQSH
jgi:transposase